jgi:ATP-dependent Lon protease
MPDTPENRNSIIQFIAQEIVSDGRIPHADASAIEAIIREARIRANKVDGINNALTLRLRELGGLIRAAGDLAAMDCSSLINAQHIAMAVERSKTAEEQIKDRYGSYSRGLGTDISLAQKEKSPYYFWNETKDSMFH